MAPASASVERDEDRDAIQAVVKRFLKLNQAAKLNEPNAQVLLTGEAAEIMTEPSVGNLPGLPDSIQFVDDDSAVVRVSSETPPEYALSVYFYVRRERSWKIHAFRALSVGIVFSLREYCREIEKIPGSDKAKAMAEINGPGALDLEHTCANAELTLKSDLQLKNWFGKNQTEIQELAMLIRQFPNVTFSVSDPDRNTVEPVNGPSQEILQSLHGLALQFGKVEDSGALMLMIGGIMDNSVYFLQTNGSSPPSIGPSEYIWVEEIAPGWYLVKTT